MAAFASLSFKTPMDTSIMPISLDSNTIAISRRADGGCSQLSFSSKSPHPPVSRPTFPSQSNPVSASITHPDTFPQPPSVQLAIPPSPPLSAAALSSTDQHDDSPAACPTRTYDPLSTAVSLTPSSSSAEANDGPPVTHLPLSAPSRHSPPRNVINHALPSTVSSDSSSTVHPPNEPAGYFSNEVGSDKTKRIGYLVEATQDFIQSASLDRRIFTTVLGLWLRIFDRSGSDGDDSGDGPSRGDGPKDDRENGASGSEHIFGLKDLCRGYATIQHCFPFADLLYIIYFAHQVELVTQSLSRKVGKGSGRGRQTVAFSETAEALGMQEKDVKAVFRKSKNYMLLLRYGGPGFLLRIGPGANALWQHRLNKDDIPLLLKYWEDHLPKLHEQAGALAPFASRILAVGMVAFGSSYHELKATSLTDSIRQHTNHQQLARDTKDLTITQTLRYLEVKGGLASLKDGIQEKRRCSDSDDARPVKRVRSLQSREPDMPGEQEMSRTGLLPMHEELDITDVTGLLPMPGEQEISMEGLLPMHEELDMSMITWLSPMPREMEMTDMTRLLSMPEAEHRSTGMQPFEGLGMSTMQPAQTLDLDASMMSNPQLTTGCPQTYENGADDTQGWT